MANVIGSPVRYAQGSGVSLELGRYAAQFAERALIIIGSHTAPIFDSILPDAFADSKCEFEEEIFCGECCKSEIDRLVQAAQDKKCGVIIGIGGGKVLDTAKAVAYYAKKPVIIMPTAASSDAPCSALSVIYTEDHIFEEYLYLPANPDLVLVDTQIVARAPVRLLVAGMGDALATYFEARACQRSNSLNCIGGHVTTTAMSIAKLCFDTLIADGMHALLAADAGAATPAVERIIEANTYMSGVGFESGGLAAAHAIHNGLTVLPGTHKMLHGEKVAFGLLAMLVLEGAPEEEIEQIVSFCVALGLPVTFAELGIPNVSADDLMKVAYRAAASDDTAHNMPVTVTPDTIFTALVGANAIGSYFSGEDEEEYGGCCGHGHGGDGEGGGCCGHEH